MGGCKDGTSWMDEMLIKVLENMSCYHIWGFETYELFLKFRNYALLEDQGGGVRAGEDVPFAIAGIKTYGAYGGGETHCVPYINFLSSVGSIL